MDRETQKIFFQGSADMDLLAEKTKELIEVTKEAGNPEMVKIEIRRADGFDGHLSPEEIIERIDEEISKTNDAFMINLLRVWKQDDYYLVVGVKI